MKKKIMFVLNYLYEGCDDNSPYTATIAVSENVNKLVEEMKDCVRQDTEIVEPNEDGDEWDETLNFNIIREDEREVVLQHRMRINLYARYFITSTKIL